MLKFEWDANKARINIRKHGVSFSDAVSVFLDEQALTIQDDYPDEERFITLGLDAFGRLLVVVYKYRADTIRIITARKATPRERVQYQEPNL